jgi:hypothetical protein
MIPATIRSGTASGGAFKDLPRCHEVHNEDEAAIGSRHSPALCFRGVLDTIPDGKRGKPQRPPV